MKKILFLGESWMKHVIHQKGFDTFTSTHYEEGFLHLKGRLEEKYEVTYIPGHRIQYDFPETVEELMNYDVVVISDVGSNTLLLSDNVFSKGKIEPNKCDMIKEYVEKGKSFLMIGGYFSFAGIDAKARYGFTALDEIMPVSCLQLDDRVEAPQGIYPSISKENSIISNIDEEWPHFFGYNKTVAKEDATVAATFGEDPFIAYMNYGKGKTAVFTSDCSPHWAPQEFLDWKNHDKLWYNIFDYLTI